MCHQRHFTRPTVQAVCSTNGDEGMGWELGAQWCSYCLSSQEGRQTLHHSSQHRVCRPSGSEAFGSLVESAGALSFYFKANELNTGRGKLENKLKRERVLLMVTSKGQAGCHLTVKWPSFILTAWSSHPHRCLQCLFSAAIQRQALVPGNCYREESHINRRFCS